MGEAVCSFQIPTTAGVIFGNRHTGGTLQLVEGVFSAVDSGPVSGHLAPGYESRWEWIVDKLNQFCRSFLCPKKPEEG
ncbi:hypothetical protein E2C01_019501 [Portunus trituberculatus]|uniref:Uncharacterized protein n=1 Tax=Portunus trituberculatus TaxID=210409 RepID=A0A5B7DZI6_PORTR|nr:hypothetical protein [Portunus trituberculatus]